MKITIKSIAEMAGVSRGTVDRALNDRPGVKPKVKENIKRIADELGYKPNPAAKALADRRYSKKKIGVLLNSEGNPFFREVICGVEASLTSLEQFGIECIICTMKGYDVEKQIAMLDELAEQNVNGIVLTPLNVPEIAAKINQLKENGIEVVAINTDVLDSARMAYVGCHYKKSGSVAAGLIGMMNNGQNEKYAVVGSSRKNLAVERRVQGIMETLEKDFPLIEIVDTLESEDNDEICYGAVKELLEREKDLTGICFAGAGNVGGIQAILDSKRKLKIVTYDLTEEIRGYLKNGIVTATICQDPYKQGYDGIDLMGKYLLWNELPVEECYFTDLSIVTKYSV